MDQIKQNKIFEALYTVKQTLLKQGFNVVYIFLQGSQNYNLDTDNSDYDFKAFIMPPKEDIYYNRETSKVYTTPYGLVEVKDIRQFPKLVGKMNPTYLELLVTGFADNADFNSDLINDKIDIKRIVEFRNQYNEFEKYVDDLVDERKTIFLHSTRGTAYAKYKGVFKSTEGTQHIIDEYGYQPKELHHLIRLYHLLKDVLEHRIPYSKALKLENKRKRNYLVNIKSGEAFKGVLLSTVEDIAERYIEKVDALTDKHLELAGPIVDTTLNKFEEQIKDLFYSELEDKFYWRNNK